MVRAFRSPSHRQIKFVCADGKGGVCAIQVMQLALSDDEFEHATEVRIDGQRFGTKVIRMNDTHNKTFAEIADWIEGL